MSLYAGGYSQALEVDLLSGKPLKQETPLKLAKGFIGGTGIASRILYDEIRPSIDPLSPENILIFTNGPLNGTRAPSNGRIEVTTKSPLTGLIGLANTGGIWGVRLKQAGYDSLIIRNAADKPAYLFIDNDQVELRDASFLWGKNTWETTDILMEGKRVSATSEVAVMAIGPAGENLVRYACPINEYYHAAARGGIGAVMGAKKLKAIVVRGTKQVPIARPDEFQSAVSEAIKLIRNHPKWDNWRHYGSFEAAAAWQQMGSLAGRNFQTGTLLQFTETRGLEALLKYKLKSFGSCYSCPMPCFNLVELNDGKYAGLKVASTTFVSSVLEFGGKCAINNLPAIWYCKDLCHKYGMDYGSASGVIAWLMELYQRGIVSKTDTDGLDLGWGNEESVHELLRRITFRQGIGDILAEGSKRAAQQIGNRSEGYAMTLKGLELMWADPRSSLPAWALSYLTNPRGGDNVRTNHCRHFPESEWPIEKWDMPENIKKQAFGKNLLDYENKMIVNKWFEDLTTFLNTLVVCFFPSVGHVALGPTQWARLLSTCTGWDITSDELMKVGERIFNLQRAYIVREGITRKDDHYPDKFYHDPMPEGRGQGKVLSREKVNRYLDEYYEARGWDKTYGWPTEEKLTELGLSDVAADLEMIKQLVFKSS